MIDPADQAADIASHGFRTTDRRKIETGDVADDVLRRQTGIVLARLGKDDKFIAVRAAYGRMAAIFADVGLDNLIKSDDDFVPDFETVLIIYLFEAADVEAQDGETIVFGTKRKNMGRIFEKLFHIGNVLFDLVHIRDADMLQIDLFVHVKPFFLNDGDEPVDGHLLLDLFIQDRGDLDALAEQSADDKLALERSAQQFLDFPEGEIETFQNDDPIQKMGLLGGVGAIACLGIDGRRLEQPDLVVVSEHFGGDLVQFRELSDFQTRTPFRR